MARDSYYPQGYKCDCGLISKHYVWASKIGESTHTCQCGQIMDVQHVYDEPINEAPGIRTPTKSHPSKVRKERLKRSRDHFKKEILPTFKPGSLEYKHFHQKYK